MLKYKLIQRGDPRDPSAPKKFYAVHVKTGTKSVADMSTDIADISSLSPGDIQNSILNMVQQSPKYLLDGLSVCLGELGTLRISFSSEGVDSEADFSVSKIRGIRVIFTPGKLIREALLKARFEKHS